MDTATLEDTKRMMLDAMGKGQQDDLIKAGLTVSSGLTWYDLSPLVQFTYSVLTPLIKWIPRVQGDGGESTHWKSVTGVNTANMPMGLSEGKRNAAITTTVKGHTATYATIGLDDTVSFEAQSASKNLSPDARATSALNLLNAARIGEEKVLLGGNYSLVLGTAVAPTLTDNSADGGAIPETTTLKVYVVGMTQYGYSLSAGKGVSIAGATILSLVTRTPLRASASEYVTGFAGKISDVTSVTTATDGNNAHTVSATTTAITGAVAYAWFWGPSTGAGALLGAITTINSIKITTEVGLGTTASNATGLATDYSYYVSDTYSPRVRDGLIANIFGAGQEDSASDSGAYHITLATGTAGTGTVLTANGTGGCTEIDAALIDRFTKYQMSFDDIWVSYQQAMDLRDIIIGGGAAPLFRLNIDAQAVDRLAGGSLSGGLVVGSYVNPVGVSMFGEGGGKVLPIHIHPFLAPGTIVFTSKKLPYPVPNIQNLLDVHTRREWYQLDFPIVERQWEYGVYCEQVLRMQAGFAFGAITNIGSSN